MATYVNNLRLTELATGEGSGTWGTTTNTNLELIGQALGFGTRAIANASTDNITIADGASDADRAMYLKLTGGGQACTVTILPNTASKVWWMENATSYTLTFTCGSGANVAVLAGETKCISTDGLGSGGVVYDVLTDVNLAGTTKVDDLVVGDDLTVTDDMTVGGTLGVTGVLTGTSLDISGDIDVDGTTNLDVVDIDGAVDMASTLTVAGVLTGASLDISGDIDVDGTTNLDVVDIDGAVDMASTLAVGGVLTANAGVVVDNITIDGNEIDVSSGNLTLDVAGVITLDSDAGGVYFKDGGTTIGEFINSSSDLMIKSAVDNKDIVFKGVDDTSTITALTLDMSSAGAATFNSTVTAGNYSTNLQTISAWTANTRAIQLSTYGSASSNDSVGYVNLTANAYESADNTWKRVAATNASGYQITYDGTHTWRTAAAGTADSTITWTTQATLSPTGAATFNSTIAAGAATFTTADNTDTLSLISTDADANAGPNFRMFRNSGSPAANDAVGLIEFEGKNDAGTTVRYAGIDTRIVDASDGTEDGRMELVTTLAGSGAISRVLMDATETVLNDNSKDLDFRVQSDGNANMLFVDGGNDRVGIGLNSPSYVLHTKSSDSINTWLQSTHATDCKLQFSSATTDDYSRIEAIAGVLKYNADVAAASASSGHEWLVDGGSKMTLNASGVLAVAGNATVGGTLGVTGAATFNSSIAATTATFTPSSGENVVITRDSGGPYFGTSSNHSLRTITNNAVASSITASGEVTMPLQPAFQVNPASVQENIAVGSDVTVVLGTEVFDVGANFASNTFTAPVTGKYQLNVSLFVNSLDTASDYYVIGIITSNRTYNFVIDPGAFSGDPIYWNIPAVVLADMDASDTALVIVNQASGTAQTDIAVGTVFSGYLAC